MRGVISYDELLAARAELANASAEAILAWAGARFADELAIASSFSVEDVALIALTREHAPKTRIFTLDTGRLPPETYEVIDAVRARYGVEVESYFPERAPVEKLVLEKGNFSFRLSIAGRKECCGLRKLEPLDRALQGRAAWMTGLRREQSVTRARLEVLELDRGIAKVNPLAAWTSAQIWDFAKQRDLPINALYFRGYSSIGCAPCTRAVAPGEDERAGRWWWETPEQKECGLHVRREG